VALSLSLRALRLSLAFSSAASCATLASSFSFASSALRFSLAFSSAFAEASLASFLIHFVK